MLTEPAFEKSALINSVFSVVMLLWAKDIRTRQS